MTFKLLTLGVIGALSFLHTSAIANAEGPPMSLVTDKIFININAPTYYPKIVNFKLGYMVLNGDYDDNCSQAATFYATPRDGKLEIHFTAIYKQGFAQDCTDSSPPMPSFLNTWTVASGKYGGLKVKYGTDTVFAEFGHYTGNGSLKDYDPTIPSNGWSKVWQVPPSK